MNRDRDARRAKHVGYLLPAPEWIADICGHNARRQTILREFNNALSSFLARQKAIDRQPKSGLDDEPVAFDYLGLMTANRRTKLDVTGIKQALIAVFNQELRGADDVARRIGRKSRAIMFPRNAILHRAAILRMIEPQSLACGINESVHATRVVAMPVGDPDRLAIFGAIEPELNFGEINAGLVELNPHNIQCSGGSWYVTCLFLLYAATIALSAFLLFEVQPIIAKMILPWFGGSAAVWTTALMFFQLTLLAGYVYSYALTTYLKPRTRATVHILLLAGSLAALPVIPSSAWRPAVDSDPTLRIVVLLAAAVGLPYFMLSSTGPLLQAWYAARRPNVIPYRLFAISNAASMLALISFPMLVEPFTSTRVQAIGWSSAYALFAILCGLVALGAERRAEQIITQHLSPQFRMLWFALPACASVLLLSVTTHLTQNVAPIPFLWVLTLALYLLSFILCFQSDRTYNRVIFIPLLVIALAGMTFATYYSYGNVAIQLSLPLFAGGLFISCMVCHGELARLKPEVHYLTHFYLMVALGGAAGGLFVAVAAPRLFNSYLEMPIAMISCAALEAFILWKQMRRLTLRIGAVVFVTALAWYVAYEQVLDRQRYLASVRNFYGVLRVTERLESDETTPTRKLVNGTIVHGQQLTDPAYKNEPTSYYGRKSGIGRLISLVQQKRHSRVGLVGLGAGVLAAYCRRGDVFRFYEINPLDIFVANHYFTFLSNCPGSCTVLPGDARMTLEREPPQQFDILAVDAFSSDSIPMHLLTREAFALYVRHLKPDGILAVHVTNCYLDLAPIVARNGEELQRPVYEVVDKGSDADYLSETTWMLVGPDTHMFVLLAFEGTPIMRRVAPKNLRTWTDDFSNLYQILK